MYLCAWSRRARAFYPCHKKWKCKGLRTIELAPNSRTRVIERTFEQPRAYIALLRGKYAPKYTFTSNAALLHHFLRETVNFFLVRKRTKKK